MTAETPYRQANVDEVRRLMEEGYDVVDVREDSEWQAGHIPGARHVVLSSIIARPHDQDFRDRTVFVCEVGGRSAVASEMAVALGLHDVVNLEGGTSAWRKAGLALEKPGEEKKR